MEYSKFKNKTPEQIYKWMMTIFHGAHYLAILLLLADLYFLYFKNVNRNPMISLLFIVIFLLSTGMGFGAKGYVIAKIGRILLQDMDPLKMLKLMEIARSKEPKRNRNKSLSTYTLFEAYSYELLGREYMEKFAEKLSEVKFKKQSADTDIMMLDYWGQYYIQSNNYEGFEKCREQWNNYMGTLGKNKKYRKKLERMENSWRFHQAALSEDLRQVEECRRHFPAPKWNIEKVAEHYWQARLAIQAGDKDKAYRELEAACTLEGSASILKKSKELLKQLKS